VAATQVLYEAEGWGTGELVVVDGRVVWHELPWPRAGDPAPIPSRTPTHPGAGAAGVLSRKPSGRGGGFVADVVRLLQAYFDGENPRLGDVPVDLDYDSPFHSRCAAALRAVPRGEVVTYGELAALAGRPGAARAAGTFCARNRFGVLVPCHRVVAATGIGSFGDLGVEYKRRLLALEGVGL
jgi:O-6-methylguanine DNA methyltransferase